MRNNGELLFYTKNNQKHLLRPFLKNRLKIRDKIECDKVLKKETPK